jgi:threonine aldolase
MINLISDTVTKPTQEMLSYMMQATVGDDVFRQDPSINTLEERMAKMFGKEAALFCPSGTMTNQIAIQMHTKALDELICDHYSHVFQYETGGYAFNAGIAVNPLVGTYGKITADQIEKAIKQDYDWLPTSSLVVLENSCNKGGGTYYTLSEIAPISALCKQKEISLHLDGARLFNVLVETSESTEEVGKHFDSISICLSKGLGAPVGSVLIGTKLDIKRARKFRKVMGGGMRQAGYLAAACLYALDHNIARLKEDNNRAKDLANHISKLSYVTDIKPVMTNIVIFELDTIKATDMVSYLAQNNINASAFGEYAVRFVTHMEIDDAMVEQVKNVMDNFSA